MSKQENLKSKENNQIGDEENGDKKIYDQYEIDLIIEAAQKKNCKIIVLQSPAEILCDILIVQQILKQILVTSSIYLLSDHLKSSCCLDITGASHIQFDLLIHFGEACFSEEISEKLLYILPKKHISNITALQDSVLSSIAKDESYLIILEQHYQYLEKLLAKTFQQHNNVSIAHIKQSKAETFSFPYLFYGYFGQLAQGSNIIIIGDNQESQFIEKLFIVKEFKKIKNILFYNCEKMKIEQLNLSLNKLFVKRLAIIEKVRQSDCFGILINNPNIMNLQNIIDHLKQILEKNKKKYYVFEMNNLTESKLKNFPEIQCYVMISCHNNALIDLKQYYMPIISPFELEQVFTEDNFKSYIVVDNKNLEIDSKNEDPTTHEEQKTNNQLDSEKSPVSFDVAEYITNNQVALQNVKKNVEFFQNRTYQGLQLNQKQEIPLAKVGKSGIAQQYNQEKW